MIYENSKHLKVQCLQTSTHSAQGLHAQNMCLPNLLILFDLKL